jgi:hypothetical protein
MAITSLPSSSCVPEALRQMASEMTAQVEAV